MGRRASFIRMGRSKFFQLIISFVIISFASVSSHGTQDSQAVRNSIRPALQKSISLVKQNQPISDFLERKKIDDLEKYLNDIKIPELTSLMKYSFSYHGSLLDFVEFLMKGIMTAASFLRYSPLAANGQSAAVAAQYMLSGQLNQFRLGQHPAGHMVPSHCFLAAIFISFSFLATNGQSAAVAAQYMLSGQQNQFCSGQHPAGHMVPSHCFLAAIFMSFSFVATKGQSAAVAAQYILSGQQNQFCS